MWLPTVTHTIIFVQFKCAKNKVVRNGTGIIVRITASNAHQVVHLKSGAAITNFLNKSLNQSNVGCHFYSICVNHLFYADDSGYCTLTCGS